MPEFINNNTVGLLSCRLIKKKLIGYLNVVGGFSENTVICSTAKLCDPLSITIEDYVFVGRHAALGSRLTIREGAWIGDHARINAAVQGLLRRSVALPDCAAGGHTEIGSYAYVGKRSRVRPGVCIGNGAAIAPRSDVVTDVPAYAVVRGRPARVVGHLEDLWTGKLDASFLGDDWRRREVGHDPR